MKGVVNVLISPHADDIALSLGLFFIDNQNERVIYNVFNLSKTEINGTDDTDMRILEETRFAEMIGAEVGFLGERDTNHRGIHWNRFGMALEKLEIERLSAVFSSLLIRIPRCFNVYIPMGLGMHPDHLLCYYSMLCALQYQYGNLSKVCFYEDYPYNLNNQLFLTSQSLISGNSHRISHHGDLKKKLQMLSLYPSQFSPSYLKELLFRFDSEIVYETGRPELIKNKLCNVDSLTSMDGIKLI